MEERQYNFELLMSYWQNKKYFPESRLTLDTTFADVLNRNNPRRWPIDNDANLHFEECSDTQSRDSESSDSDTGARHWEILEGMGFNY